MKRTEFKFISPLGQDTARRLGAAVRAARLARNLTQESAAARARMGTLTWLRIEHGEVAVSFSSWLSALELVGLLPVLAATLDPSADPVGVALRQSQARVRARPGTSADFDF